MNGAVLVDSLGVPVRPALIWADVRAAEQAARLAERCGIWHVYERTGHRPSASCTASKVMWVKQHQPELYSRTAHVIQAKDYGALLLTGVCGTDYSDASPPTCSTSNAVSGPLTLCRRPVSILPSSRRRIHPQP